MNMDREAALDMLLARATIQDILARYSRALDRCDIDILKSVFWPDAHDDHGMFVGNIDEFAEFSMKTLATMDRTMHLVANCVIDFDDADHARSETYIVAWHDIAGDIATSHLVAGGRYLDRFERRSGEWRILERVFISDWHQSQYSTANWDGAMLAQITRRGGRFPNDPAFGFLDPAGAVAGPVTAD
jgi:hypothetical protein